MEAKHRQTTGLNRFSHFAQVPVSLFPFAEGRFADIFNLALQGRKPFATMSGRVPSLRCNADTKRGLPDT
jgi:hypothetical protein